MANLYYQHIWHKLSSNFVSFYFVIIFTQNDNISYLFLGIMHSRFRDTSGRDLSSSFAFIHPSTYMLNDEFNTYVVQRLKDGVNRMNFMPFNYKHV